LAKLQLIIANHFTADVLDSQRDDLMDLLKKSIKKGGTRECILAANGKYEPAMNGRITRETCLVVYCPWMTMHCEK